MKYYYYEKNIITTPRKNITGTCILNVIKNSQQTEKSEIKPKIQIIYNEVSEDLGHYVEETIKQFQLVPPNMNCRKSA